MRACSLALIVTLVAAGCAADNSGGLASEHTGIAELRVDAASLSAAHVTRVVVETAGETQELVFNNASGSYDATLFLASGPQTLVGRAFSDDLLVGASNPVTLDVTPGKVNRVILRILDLRVATPVFGPVFDSLTFPTTVNAGATATFALSVIAPAQDPIAYQWSSDCTDSTFAEPGAAQTGWSKPSQGSCRIDVVATSNGFSITQSFLIVVFSAAGSGGAVTINGAFVTGPQLQLGLQTSTQACLEFSLPGNNSSCPITASAPVTLDIRMAAFDWGNSTPGGFALSDDCGGHFGIDRQTSDFLIGSWMPPAAGGLCILTLRAINSDGITTALSSAILTRPGTIPATPPPVVSAALGTCSFSAPQDAPQDCGEFAANAQLDFGAGFFWPDSRSGIVTVTDDCGGGQFHNTDRIVFGRTWTPSSAPGSTCHLTVNATNLEGVTTTASALYRLF